MKTNFVEILLFEIKSHRIYIRFDNLMYSHFESSEKISFFPFF